MENKTSKYFKYAIGEIILVVIGILIALQINNWNEAKKTKEKERQVLTEIESDLDYSLMAFDRVLSKGTNNINRTVNSIQVIIETLETNQKYHDSLDNHFSAANSYDEVNFKISGYQSLISIGTDLIEDSELRSKIGKFYTSTIQDTKAVFEEVKMDFHEYMLDYIRKDFNTIVNKEARNTLKPNDFEALKTNKVYIQSLKSYLAVNKYYSRKLNFANEEANQLKKDIDNYLN